MYLLLIAGLVLAEPNAHTLTPSVMPNNTSNYPLQLWHKKSASAEPSKGRLFLFLAVLTEQPFAYSPT